MLTRTVAMVLFMAMMATSLVCCYNYGQQATTQVMVRGTVIR